MPTQAVAQIIPFPVRRATASPAPGPAPALDGQERLARAMASLNAALAEQRAALAAWCGALAELKTTTEGLAGRLRQYHGSLNALGTRVGSLKEEAVKLEAWADKVLDAQG